MTMFFLINNGNKDRLESNTPQSHNYVEVDWFQVAIGPFITSFIIIPFKQPMVKIYNDMSYLIF